MKIGGIDPKTLPKEEILVLPRGDEEVVFRAVGIPDYEEFNKLCPAPTPPGRLTKDGWEYDEDDADYKSLMESYAARRLAWMVITSLEPSQISWDSVSPSKASTWVNWQTDLKANGFSQIECNRIIQLVFQANCLDEEKLKRARDVFLRGRQPAPNAFSGPSIAPENTPSGEPVAE